MYAHKDPMTLPERLDAAETDAEFGQVLTGFFAAIDHARQQEDAGDTE